MRLIHTRYPGEIKYFKNSGMVLTDCSWGALRARMTEPRMHSVQPIQPCESDPCC